MEADRYGVSNRAAAAICTATLVDYGIISLEDQINIVDPHKVWRARLQLRRAIRATPINNEEEIMAIFFDGRKDMTLMREKRGDKWYSTKKNEEHYVMIGEPGTIYLCHLTLEQGTGSAISDSIHNAIEERGITDKIMAVGDDSTAVNTGHRGGAIHLLELHTGRPLQWFICSLHLNELPFRHLCKHLLEQLKDPHCGKDQFEKHWLLVHHFHFLQKDFDSLPTVILFQKSTSANLRSEEHTSELQSRGLISYAVF